MHRILRLTPIATLAVLFWLFIGFENNYYDLEDHYAPFIKQHATLRTHYENPVLPGSSDLRFLEDLTEDQRAEFGEFCRVRYDLDWRRCFAIFAEEQRLADRHIHARKPDSMIITSSGLPKDVDDVIVERERCDDLRREFPDLRRIDGDHWIHNELASYCPNVDARLAHVQAKYLRIVSALAVYGKPRDAAIRSAVKQ